VNAISESAEIKELAHSILEMSDMSKSIDFQAKFDNLFSSFSSILGFNLNDEELLNTNQLTTINEEENKETKVKFNASNTRHMDKEEKMSIQKFILKHVISACEGNSQSLGLLYDIFRTNGEVYTGTFLGFISTSKDPYIFNDTKHGTAIC
jgi:hypothetical protein